MFNPETAEQDEINRLLELSKHNDDDLKTLNDKVKSIIDGQKRDDEKLKDLNYILDPLIKNKVKPTLESILNTNKDGLVTLLKKANEAVENNKNDFVDINSEQFKTGENWSSYLHFKELFNQIKTILGGDKVVGLDNIINYSKSKAKLKNKDNANPNDKKDILERLDDTKDLININKIEEISGELKKIIGAAKTDKEKLNKVFEVINKVYNDTGGKADIGKTFGIDQLTKLIKDNCNSLVDLLENNQNSDFYNNFKNLFYKKSYFKENGLRVWINDQETKDKLEKVLPKEVANK